MRYFIDNYVLEYHGERDEGRAFTVRKTGDKNYTTKRKFNINENNFTLYQKMILSNLDDLITAHLMSQDNIYTHNNITPPTQVGLLLGH